MLRNTRGISTVYLIILLIASGVVGAVLSYLWTAGYYVELGLSVPENTTTVAITNMTFSAEDCSYFRVTLMNPTFSEGDAEITGIALVGAGAGYTAINDTDPSLPYSLKKGESMTFRCNTNWGDYAGEQVNVTVFVTDGSGAASSHPTEFVKLEITNFAYNSSVTIEQFNVTMTNNSDIPLDLSKVSLGGDEIPQSNISVDGQSITLPYRIPQDENRVLVCNWKLWDSETESGVLGTTTKVTAETLQGYRATRLFTLLGPVSLTVSNVTFLGTNMTQFILSNLPKSPYGVNLTQVAITVGTQTYPIAAENTNATSLFLPRDSNVTIVCEDPSFNWEAWQGQTVKVRVYTTQGFLAVAEDVIP